MISPHNRSARWNGQSLGSAKHQDGVVLVVALVLLLAITLLSLAGMSTTTLELMMATNQQARVNAFQQAETGIDAVTSNLDNFRVTGPVGASRCTAEFHNQRYYDATGEIDCDAFDLALPAGFDLTRSRAVVERLPPLLQPAPRFMEASFENLKVATFKIDSRYDAREVRGGRAEHAQGMLVTVLTTGEETVISGEDGELSQGTVE